METGLSERVCCELSCDMLDSQKLIYSNFSSNHYGKENQDLGTA